MNDENKLTKYNYFKLDKDGNKNHIISIKAKSIIDADEGFEELIGNNPSGAGIVVTLE